MGLGKAVVMSESEMMVLFFFVYGNKMPQKLAIYTCIYIKRKTKKCPTKNNLQ